MGLWLLIALAVAIAAILLFRGLARRSALAYSIDPRLLRPTDTFNALNRMDSWTLGKGEEEIGKWIEHKGLGTPPELHTILALAQWVQFPAPSGTTK